MLVHGADVSMLGELEHVQLVLPSIVRIVQALSIEVGWGTYAQPKVTAVIPNKKRSILKSKAEIVGSNLLLIYGLLVGLMGGAYGP
jgi:hypothetical protein